MSALKYWLWLTTRRGMQPEDAFRLLEHFGTCEATYFAPREEYALAPVSDGVRASLEDKDLSGAERILSKCEEQGIRILTLQDAEYPERLKQIYDPPCVLYIKGRLFAFDEEVAIALVGSRTPSEYGRRMAGKLGLELARAGALVVSGIAQGLDTEAVRGALKGGGSPVCILGGGCDVIYPARNRALYEDVAAVGALISEYPPGTQIQSWHFPVRNRIISGLSVGVCAVEAREKSGTLITTALALEQDREVFAVPGNADAPMSRGTNLLIQRGEAKLVTGAWDILVEFESRFPGRLRRQEELPPEAREERLSGGEAQGAAQGAPTAQEKGAGAKEVDKKRQREYITLTDRSERFTDDEKEILLTLGEREMRTDDIVERTQIPARRVSSALTMLQIQGLVEEQTGGRFAANVILRES